MIEINEVSARFKASIAKFQPCGSRGGFLKIEIHAGLDPELIAFFGRFFEKHGDCYFNFEDAQQELELEDEDQNVSY